MFLTEKGNEMSKRHRTPTHEGTPCAGTPTSSARQESWFSDGPNRFRLMAGLSDLRCVSQPKGFCDSVRRFSEKR